MRVDDRIKIHSKVGEKLEAEARPRLRIHMRPVHTVLTIESGLNLRETRLRKSADFSDRRHDELQ